MDDIALRLTRAIDGYCERIDAGLWAEPVNAVTNLAFVLAALLMWRRSGDEGVGRALAGVLLLIGIGSGLFHTFAQVWAAILDTLPILAFILIYLFAVNRDVLGLRPVRALLATGLFLPYAALTAPLWADVPVLGASAGYLPVPTLIVIYAAFLRGTYPVLARGMLIGAGVLLMSLLARSLDAPMCPRFAIGTHFLWHLLNALMLAWMIEIYLRFRRSPA